MAPHPEPPRVNVTELPSGVPARQPTQSQIEYQASAQGFTLTSRSAPYGNSFIVRVQCDELEISWLHPSRKPQRRWSRRQLADVRVERDYSGDGPVSYLVELHPHPGEGMKVALPIWDEADARWMTATLRLALRIPDPPPPGQLPAFLERDEQPAGSKITLERSADGVSLTVPAAGWLHPSLRPVFLWSAAFFGLAIGGGPLLWWLAEAITVREGDVVDPNTPGTFMGNFFAVMAVIWICIWTFGGLWNLVIGVWRAHWRHAQLVVAGDLLMLRSTTLFGTRSWQWERASVVDVRIGRTWGEFEEANCELQIHLKDGKIVRVLPGYGDQELQWLATVLRRTLRVPNDALTAQDP
jgi:hypothetical protein